MHGFSGHFRFATPAPPYSKARTEPWHSFESDPIWQTKMYLKILLEIYMKAACLVSKSHHNIWHMLIFCVLS